MATSTVTPLARSSGRSSSAHAQEKDPWVIKGGEGARSTHASP